MNDVRNVILSMRRRVIVALTKDPEEVGNKQFMSWVMTTLVSLACDLHKKSGGSFDSLVQFTKVVWELPLQEGQSKNKNIVN